MTILLILLAITAALAGIREGMIMILPLDKMVNKDWTFLHGTLHDEGVRMHAWFKYYHGIRGALWGFGALFIATLIAGLFVQLLPIRDMVWWFKYLPIITWLHPVLWFFAAWDIFEYGYSYARYKTLINKDVPESVNFFDVKVKIWWYGYNIPIEQLFKMEVKNIVKLKKNWHKVQIHPFHAPSKWMHVFRGVVIAGLVAIVIL